MSTRLLVCVALAISATATAREPGSMTVSDQPFVAEGLAVASNGNVLVSGVFARTVVELRDGKVIPFLQAGSLAPTGGLFGMARDHRRNRLWIGETSGPKVPGSTGPRRTGVLEVELTTGRALARYLAPEGNGDHFIGDVVVTTDGEVYATDSFGGLLYRLNRQTQALDIVLATGLKSLQGIVQGFEPSSLIFSAYGTGLHRITGLDRTSPMVAPVQGSPNGLDGVTRCGKSLIVTRNADNPNQVLQLTLAGDESSVTDKKVLASGPPLAEDLSLGIVRGAQYLYVRRSQWSAFDAEGALTRTPTAAELGVLALRCRI